jgi:hypothetical protein
VLDEYTHSALVIVQGDLGGKFDILGADITDHFRKNVKMNMSLILNSY